MIRFGTKVTSLVTSAALVMSLAPTSAFAEIGDASISSEADSSAEVQVVAPEASTAAPDSSASDVQSSVEDQTAVTSSPSDVSDSASEETSSSATENVADVGETNLVVTKPEETTSEVDKLEESTSEVEKPEEATSAAAPSEEREGEDVPEEDGETFYDGIDTQLYAAQVDKSGAWSRLWGQTAYDTMQVILRTDGEFPDGSGGTVIVATGDGYWDALSASGLAGINKAPVIITNGDRLNAQAKAEIARIKPKKILVMGGPIAITPTCYEQIKAMCPSGTKRIWGERADDTAVKIYEEGKDWGKTAVIATSGGYWDALSIAPFAYSKNAPVFLTIAGQPNNKKLLSDFTLSALRTGGFERVIIVGGPVAVPKSAEEQLASIGFGKERVERIYGDTAIETSGKIAAWELKDEEMSLESLAVATTDGYWDALTGAALAGKQNAILVLVGPNGDYRALDAVYGYNGTVSNGHVFGGPVAISDGIFERISGAFYIASLTASAASGKVGSSVKLTVKVGGNAPDAVCTWEWARSDGSAKGSAKGSLAYDFKPTIGGIYNVTATVAASGEQHCATTTVEFSGQGGTVGDLLAVAREDIGYSMYDDPESGSKFGRWFAGYTGNEVFGWNGVAYCAMAVSYWCDKAGVPCAGLPSAGCENIYFAALDAGRFVDKGKLQPGMLILFDWDYDNLPDHIGIVEKRVDGDTYQTLEGNTSLGNAGSQDNGGRVARRQRDYNVIIGGVNPYFK